MGDERKISKIIYPEKFNGHRIAVYEGFNNELKR